MTAVQLGKLAATSRAFAGHGFGGSVVTWGYPDDGGNSTQAQDQLRNVQHIQATERAFAAMLESGAVVTWGDPVFGADSSQVQGQLRNVQHIQATERAFAAIWGGDSSQAQEQLRKVQHIQETVSAFAAILESGAVVTWSSRWWRGQHPGARSAEERPAHPSNYRCFCCNS